MHKFTSYLISKTKYDSVTVGIVAFPAGIGKTVDGITPGREVVKLYPLISSYGISDTYCPSLTSCQATRKKRSRIYSSKSYTLLFR